MKRTEKTDKILVKYKQYLKLEKSLSDNTVDAYLTDLDKLLAYLTLENINILDVRLENLEDFSAGLHDIGIHPRSQARILSGIRSFYRFLIMEDYLKADPTELLESPQTGFKLPRGVEGRRVVQSGVDFFTSGQTFLSGIHQALGTLQRKQVRTHAGG